MLAHLKIGNTRNMANYVLLILQSVSEGQLSKQTQSRPGKQVFRGKSTIFIWGKKCQIFTIWSFLGGYWWGRYRKCMWPGPGQWRNFPQNNKKLHQSEFSLHFHSHCFHMHHFHFPHFHIHTLRHDWIYIANKRGAKRAINQYQVCLDSNTCNFTKVTQLCRLQLFLFNAKVT